MKLKIYKSYILKSYLYYLLLITLIFFMLICFLNILEEIVFLEKYNISISYPVLLTFLNSPSILFEIFPFIFLISSQMFFINLYEKEELNLLKAMGIDNLSLINLITLITFGFGIFITIFFYTFSYKEIEYNFLLIY